MRKIMILTVLLISILAAPYPAAAQAGVSPTPGGVRIELPQVSGGGNQVIDQPVNRDLMTAGGNISVSAPVTGDAYVAGGQITISGDIGGNLIVAGGNVSVTGKIGKNLIVAGGEVNLNNPNGVGGYVLAAGGSIRLNGQYNGPVRAAGGSLNVSGESRINGDLVADVSQANISDQAVISGEKKITIYEDKRPEAAREAAGRFNTAGRIISFLGKLLILLLLVRFLGNFLEPAKEFLKSVWQSMGWGLAVLVITPFLILALLATVIGIPLALILGALYLTALYLSSVFTAGALGSWIAQQGWIRTDNPYLQAIVGLVVISIAGIIPVVEWFVRLAVLLTGLGIIYRLIRERRLTASGR